MLVKSSERPLSRSGFHGFWQPFHITPDFLSKTSAYQWTCAERPQLAPPQLSAYDNFTADTGCPIAVKNCRSPPGAVVPVSPMSGRPRRNAAFFNDPAHRETLWPRWLECQPHSEARHQIEPEFARLSAAENSGQNRQ